MVWRRAVPVWLARALLQRLGVDFKAPDCLHSFDYDSREGRTFTGRDLASAKLPGAGQAPPMVDYSPIVGLRPLGRVEAGPAVGRVVRGAMQCVPELGESWLACRSMHDMSASGPLSNSRAPQASGVGDGPMADGDSRRC